LLVPLIPKLKKKLKKLMLAVEKIEELDTQSQSLEPQEILARAIELVPDIAISFSGAEDVALVAMATRIKPDIRVFTLDTGRLHPQTYRFIEKVRNHYQVNIEILTPDAKRLEAFVLKKGLYSFYQDGHEECCNIRKIEPLRRLLTNTSGWITGQRRDQSPTRANVPVFQVDETFSTPEKSLIKVNPMANWSSQDVWQYIRMFDVPYNELHDQGYVSIGCEPCTKPTGPGQHEREGRWWWEESTIKECGLHNRGSAASQIPEQD
jgi:phosphoadenosine phosphosulfate reductase